MGKAGLLLNGVVLTGVLTLLLGDAGARPAPVVSELDSTLAELEVAAAKAPTPERVGELATAYMDRKQPGLAQAVLDRHSEMAGVALSQARSRAALARGDVAEAARLNELVLATCEGPGDGCTAAVVGRALQQAAYLRSLERAGIDDPGSEPGAARQALAVSRREVALAAP